MASLMMNDCVGSSEELTRYLMEKGQGHNHYKVYARMERILSIRENKELYLSCGDDWNDVADRKKFNNIGQEHVNFGRCFSFSLEENIALWMLYGGIEKRGGMMDFTKRGIKSILEVPEVEAGYFEDNKFVPLMKLNREQFSIFMIDVLYFSKKNNNNNTYFVKRYDESVLKLPGEVFEGLSGCTKAYPWQYENECRLIVSVPKAALDTRCKHVRINLDGLNMGKSFERVYCSPNYVGSIPENVKKNDYKDDVDWDLCRYCERK